MTTVRANRSFAARTLAWPLTALLWCGCVVPLPASAAPTEPAALVAAPSGEPVTTRLKQLSAVDYIEEERFLHGQAQAYSPIGDWGQDGKWSVKPRDAAQPYQTRLLVRRPKDPARFNGIVVVEWLNTTMGFDLDGGWVLTHDEIEREGYAWVGVSAEAESVQSLKAMNPSRYAQALLANTDMAFDVFTQVAELVRKEAPAWGSAAAASNIKLLGLGYSQSAVFLSTYINAFQPVSKAYDGFYMRSTAPAANKVESTDSHVFAPQIRSDLAVPVMQLQTEMEVMVSWTLSKTPDTGKVRYWEIAGATHFDKYLQEQTLPIGNDEFKSITPHCFKPTNTLPARDFDHAALHALRLWVTAGTPPPKAPRLQRNGLGFVKSDELGNALGGLRLPELDAPLAQYGMYSNMSTNSLRKRATYACVAGGSTNPLDADVLHARYASSQAYVDVYKQSADKLLNEGFLRPADHAQLIEHAKRVKLPQ